MTTELPAIFDCSMCDVRRESQWSKLVQHGWRQHFAAAGLAPIRLCPGCGTEIENRRRKAKAEIAQLKALL